MREVTHSATGPRRLTVDDIDPTYGDVAICLCGLSDDGPFCDGSHRRAEGEKPGTRYKYVDGERRRVELVLVEGDDGDEGGDAEMIREADEDDGGT